jgi:hypothetical protein
MTNSQRAAYTKGQNQDRVTADQRMAAKYLGYKPGAEEMWRYGGLLAGWRAGEEAVAKGNAVRADRDNAAKKAYYGGSAKKYYGG